MLEGAVRDAPRSRSHAPGIAHRVARAAWQRLTSVRFAVGLIAAIAVAALLGVLFPQMPEGVRASPELQQDFLDQQDGYGPLLPLVERLQLFSVFHSWWFLGLLCLLTVSVSVCTVSRFPPIRRQVVHPVLRVPDTYFEHAHHRATFEDPPGLTAVIAGLRRRQYRVVVVDAAQGRIYADRFRWAAFGTFASHLSLVIFLAGGLVTWAFEDRTQLLVAEGQAAAVFAPADQRHMQVRLLDFEHRVSPEGRDLGFESHIEVYRRGELLASGRTSINRPLHAGGFTFHQSAFLEQGAALRVTDAQGHVVFDDVLALQGVMPVPVVRVLGDAGQIIFDGPAPPRFVLRGVTAASSVALPGGRELALALRPLPDGNAWSLVVSSAGGVIEGSVGEQLVLGDDYRVVFEGVTASASGVARLPGETDGDWLVQLLSGAGRSLLTLVAPDGTEARLGPGETVEAGGFTYRFDGQRSFSGLTVRNDPGSAFIWIAAALLLGGLALTFYVPRRQLWLLHEGHRLRVAGVGHVRRALAQELGWLQVSRPSSRPF